MQHLTDLVPHAEPHALEVGGDMSVKLLLGEVRGGLEDSDVNRSCVVKGIIQRPEGEGF
jgi:hypothetical protein